MKNILIIEDDQVDQYIAKTNISRVYGDVTVHSVFDGQQALDWLSTSGIVPEVILLDINMPRMNGHDFLAKFSEVHDGKIPVVAMLTSSDQGDDKARTMAYSFVVDYFIKPITEPDVKSLADLIKTLSEDAD